MQYVVKNKDYVYISDEELLSTLLKQRGVNEPKTLLNLTPDVIHSGMLLKNIEFGLKLLNYHLNNESKILIIVDSDVDGYTSSALIFDYIKKVSGMECQFVIHKGKEHGIKAETIGDREFDLLIVADAGTNDVEECERLANEGKDILILDHHEIEFENHHACVINNQDGQYPNTTLSGVGVVYKFCREYDRMFGFEYANCYLDLVALGMIADSMDVRNFETRFYVMEGLKRIGLDNEFINELAIKQEYQIKGNPTIHNVGWYIAPIINGVVRFGSHENKVDMFRAMAGFEDVIEYKPRKSRNNPDPQVELQSLQKGMARICCSIKSKQDNDVKKGKALVVDRIMELGLDKNKIIFVDVTDILAQSYTGLVANKIASEFKRPCILLREKKDNENVYGGSGRNYSRFAMDNLRSFLLDSGTFEWVSGHNNSFGFNLKRSNLKMANAYANEKLQNVSIEDVYHCDYEIAVGRLKERHIMQVGQWADMWGNTLPEPVFAITDIFIDSEDIKLLGEKRNFIKFDVIRGDNKITFIKKYTNEAFYNQIIHKNARGLSVGDSKKLEVTVIGKFTINEWEANDKVFRTPQIEIIDIETKVAKRKVMF